MTEDLVRVCRVSQGPVRGGATQFVMDCTLVARPSEPLQLQTLSAWAASLCQEAKDRGRAIAVRHEHTAYGETLRSAHFLKVT